MKTTVEISMNGKAVGAELSTFLKSISYREAIDGEADTLEVTLHDVAGLFTADWFPTRGMSIELTIMTEWYSMPLGEFAIDEIENSFPPAECKIKATSIPPTSSVRSVEKSRSWEQVTLSTIAKDVADDAGLKLVFDATDDPMIDRAEQSEQSDLRFLHKLCADNGLALKLNDKQLIVFDYEEYEKASAVATLSKGADMIKRFSVRSTLNEVYTRCEVSYKSGKKGELISGSYDAGGISTLFNGGGKTLKINKRVESEAAARKLAKKKLQEKNRDETVLQLSLVGNVALRAGATIEIDGFNVFDGKYLIKSARHGIGGGGYETEVECTRCMG